MSNYLISSLIFYFFFMVLGKMFYQFSKKKITPNLALSNIKTKVAVKFLKKTFFFWPKIDLAMKGLISFIFCPGKI